MKITLHDLIPLSLLLGIGIIIAGFLYDAFFAGIPFQDPTPQMTVHYNQQKIVASWFYLSGCAIFSLGFAGGVATFVWERIRILNNKYKKDKNA